MPTVLAILPEGFEELEAVAPIDLLRRASCTVTVAALGPTRRVTGRNQLVLEADVLLDDLVAGPAAPQIPNAKSQTPNFDADPTINPPPTLYDCLLLPGGPGVQHLRASAAVRELVLSHHAAGSLLAAICAAPTVLHDAGLLAGKRYTAHPSVAGELTAILADERVVQDGRIVTSRGAGTAIDFGLALVAILVSPQKAAEVAEAIRF